ncbi:MAG TPA: arginase family protein [Kribbella sp.]
MTVEVPESDSPMADGVRAADALVAVQRATKAALWTIDDFILIAGGDCAVDLVPISAAAERYGEDLTVLWIDANTDVYGPGDPFSGAFHGMVVRTLLGDGPPALSPKRPLTPHQVVFTGVRVIDDCEQEYLRSKGLRPYGVDDLEAAVDGLQGPLYVHVDLDVLDPAEFASVGYSYPAGPSVARVLDLIAGLDDVVGAAITEHAPRARNPREEVIVRALGTALLRFA